MLVGAEQTCLGDRPTRHDPPGRSQAHREQEQGNGWWPGQQRATEGNPCPAKAKSQTRHNLSPAFHLSSAHERNTPALVHLLSCTNAGATISPELPQDSEEVEVTQTNVLKGPCFFSLRARLQGSGSVLAIRERQIKCWLITVRLAFSRNSL